jgi:hypothetical protein
MKLFAFAFCCLSIAALADECPTMEYAEMKDLPKATLYKKYCMYLTSAHIAQAGATLPPGTPLPPDSPVYDVLLANERQAKQCTAEAERYRRLLILKYHIQNPDCYKPRKRSSR